MLFDFQSVSLQLYLAIHVCSYILRYLKTTVSCHNLKLYKYVSLLAVLLISFCSQATQQSIANGPIYKVELVVFAHVTEQGLLSEVWPATPELPNMQRVYNLKLRPQLIQSANQNAVSVSQVQPQLYQILPSANFTLKKEASKLEANGDYPVLVHVAWLQPGLPIRNSRRIHIYGGQAYTAAGQLATAISPLNMDNNTDLPAPSSDTRWQLNGYVRVSKPYLFQLNADLVLTIPQQLLAQVSSAAARQLQTNQFVLRQTFRMKLNQLYYIDHPLFGILAEVTKYSK